MNLKHNHPPFVNQWYFIIFLEINLLKFGKNTIRKNGFMSCTCIASAIEIVMNLTVHKYLKKIIFGWHFCFGPMIRGHWGLRYFTFWRVFPQSFFKYTILKYQCYFHFLQCNPFPACIDWQKNNFYFWYLTL